MKKSKTLMPILATAITPAVCLTSCAVWHKHVELEMKQSNTRYFTTGTQKTKIDWGGNIVLKTKFAQSYTVTNMTFVFTKYDLGKSVRIASNSIDYSVKRNGSEIKKGNFTWSSIYNHYECDLSSSPLPLIANDEMVIEFNLIGDNVSTEWECILSI